MSRKRSEGRHRASAAASAPPVSSAETAAASKDFRKNLWIAAAFALVIFATDRIFKEKIYQFDGVMFGSMAQGPWPQAAQGQVNSMFYYTSHFLYPTTGWLFHQALRSLGFSMDGYSSLQILNNLLGALGAAALFLYLAGRAGRLPAVLSAALLCFSFNYWTRSNEGQVYMPATFWFILAVIMILKYAEKWNVRDLVLAAACTIMAMLYHISHGMFVMAVCLWLLLLKPHPKWLRDIFIFGGIVSAVIFLVIGIPHRLYELESLKRWWFVGSLGQTSIGGASGAAAGPSALQSLVNLIRDYSRWFVVGPSDPVLAGKFTFGYLSLPSLPAIGNSVKIFWEVWYTPGRFFLALVPALLVFAGSVLLVKNVAWTALWQRHKSRWSFLGITFAFYTIFYTMWVGLWHFKLFQMVPFAIALAYFWLEGLTAPDSAAAPAAPSRKFQTALLVAGVVLTAAYNFAYGVFPQSKLSNNQDLVRSHYIGANTRQQSIVFLPGTGWTWGKVYLSYFEQRRREAMDLWLYSMPKDRALEQWSQYLGQVFRAGWSAYVLSDWNWVHAQSYLDEHWKLSVQDVDKLFEPYQKIEIGSPDKSGDPKRDYMVLYELFPKSAAAQDWANLAARYLNFQNTQPRVPKSNPQYLPAAQALEEALRRRAGQPAPVVRQWCQTLGDIYTKLGRPEKAAKAFAMARAAAR